MNINKTRRSTGVKPGLVLLALLALGIVVTLGAINSKTPPAPAAVTGDLTIGIDANESRDDSPFSGSRYLMTIALLAAGGGLALYLRGRTGKAASGGEITLIERHQIRQGHELRLVEVGGDRILIGVSPNQLCVLHTSKASASAEDADIRQAVELGGSDLAPTQRARLGRPIGQPTETNKRPTRMAVRSTVLRQGSGVGFAAAIADAREMIIPEKSSPTQTPISTTKSSRPASSDGRRQVSQSPGVYAGTGTTPFGSLTSFSDAIDRASNGRQHV